MAQCSVPKVTVSVSNIFQFHYLNCLPLIVLGSRIDTAEAFYLYASGPDLTSIMPCKYGKPHGILSKYVTQEGLQCEQIRELLMRNTEVDISPLTVSYHTYTCVSFTAYTL